MANFFISDLHIGHANVIRFDQRPFANLSEMHEAIVTNWNSVVTGNDTVYILGDFIWGKDSEWPFYVAPLAGNKVLLRGNHDIKGMSKETRKLFADFKDYMEISDGDRRLILIIIRFHFIIMTFLRTATCSTVMFIQHWSISISGAFESRSRRVGRKMEIHAVTLSMSDV